MSGRCRHTAQSSCRRTQVKKCTKCRVLQDIECFAIEKRSKDGRSTQCKSCKNAYDFQTRTKKYVKRVCANVDCGKEFVNRRRKKFCSDWCSKRVGQIRWAKNNPDKRRRTRLKYGYGIDLHQFDQMLANQGGLCAMCEKPFVDGTPCIDHDHSCCPGQKTCGKCVRGLLHQSCNKALGILNDDPELCSKAARYLVRTKYEGNLQESVGRL